MKLSSRLKIIISFFVFQLLIQCYYQIEPESRKASSDNCWGVQEDNLVPYHYHLNLYIDMYDNVFKGVATIEINGNHNTIGWIHACNLTIDEIFLNNYYKLSFCYKSIDLLQINFGDHSISQIENNLTFHYKGSLQSMERGLHKYKIYDFDKKRAKTIILSKIFPANAHYIFPCLNYPSFKTNFSLIINLENSVGYTPVFNTPIQETIDQSVQVYIFETTVQLPLHALIISIIEFENITFALFPEINITVYSMKKITEMEKRVISTYTDTVYEYILFLMKQYSVKPTPVDLHIILTNGFRQVSWKGWGIIVVHYSFITKCPTNVQKCFPLKLHQILHPITKMFFGIWVTPKQWIYYHFLEALGILITMQFVNWKVLNSVDEPWYYHGFLYQTMYQTSKINIQPLLKNCSYSFDHEMSFVLEETYSYKVLGLIFMFRLEHEFFNQNVGGTCILSSEIFDITRFYDCLYIKYPLSKGWLIQWLQQKNYPLVYVYSKNEIIFLCTISIFTYSFNNNVSDSFCAHNFPLEAALYENNSIVDTTIGIVGPHICRHTIISRTTTTVNANYLGRGYYRTAYSENIYVNHTNNFMSFSTKEKCVYIADIFSLANVGVISFKYVFELIKIFPKVREESPWHIFYKQIVYIGRRLIPVADTFSEFIKFIENVFQPHIKNQKSNIKFFVTSMMCQLYHPSCTDKLTISLKKFIKKPSAVGNISGSDLQSALFNGVALLDTNKNETISDLWNISRFISHPSPLIIRSSLLQVTNSMILQRVLNSILREELFDEDEFFELLMKIGKSRYGYFIVWRLLLEKTDFLLRKMTLVQLGTIIYSIEETHVQKVLVPKEKLAKFYKRFEGNPFMDEVKRRAEEHIQFNLDWLDQRENDIREQLGIKKRSCGDSIFKNVIFINFAFAIIFVL